MRIVLTTQGANYFNQIQDEFQEIRKNRVERKRQRIEKEKRIEYETQKLRQRSDSRGKNRSNTTKPFETRTHQITKSFHSQYPNQQDDESELSKPSHQEDFKLRLKKIYIPKFILEQYNSPKHDTMPDQQESIIMPNLPTNFTRTKLLNRDGSKKKFVNVKDILNEETLSNLKKQKLMAKVVKDLNTVIDENNFRTNYQEKDVIEELLEKLNVNIDVNKINLIKYLNSKHEVSEKFIKKFEKFSEEKINKMNKICQIMTYKNELQKFDKDIIKEKLHDSLNKTKIEFKEAIDTMQDEVHEIKGILSAYNLRYKSRKKKSDIFLQVKNKYNNDTKTGFSVGKSQGVDTRLNTTYNLPAVKRNPRTLEFLGKGAS